MSTIWPRGYTTIGGEYLGLLSLLLSGSWLETGSCGSQDPSQEVVPSDLPTTHILSYQRSLTSLLSAPRSPSSSTFSSFASFYFIRPTRLHYAKLASSFITWKVNASMRKWRKLFTRTSHISRKTNPVRRVMSVLPWLWVGAGTVGICALLFFLESMYVWTTCLCRDKPASEVSSPGCLFLSGRRWLLRRHKGRTDWNNWGPPANFP